LAAIDKNRDNAATRVPVADFLPERQLIGVTGKIPDLI
jgi:hypothetical protein